jgi:hypothetical protein
MLEFCESDDDDDDNDDNENIIYYPGKHVRNLVQTFINLLYNKFFNYDIWGSK